MSTIRTFIAVDVSPKVQSGAEFVIEKLEACEAGYNWVETERMHLTLKFLGDVPEEEIPQICRLVKDAVKGFAPFPVEFSSLGCFPAPEKPRVVWLGTSEGSEHLCQLHERISKKLKEMRFPLDRKDFQPHLTIGRLQRGGHWNKSLSDVLVKHADFYSGGCDVDQVIVYASYLDRAGPSYTPMAKIALR